MTTTTPRLDVITPRPTTHESHHELRPAADHGAFARTLRHATEEQRVKDEPAPARESARRERPEKKSDAPPPSGRAGDAPKARPAHARRATASSEPPRADDDVVAARDDVAEEPAIALDPAPLPEESAPAKPDDALAAAWLAATPIPLPVAPAPPPIALAVSLAAAPQTSPSAPRPLDGSGLIHPEAAAVLPPEVPAIAPLATEPAAAVKPAEVAEAATVAPAIANAIPRAATADRPEAARQRVNVARAHREAAPPRVDHATITTPPRDAAPSARAASSAPPQAAARAASEPANAAARAPAAPSGARQVTRSEINVTAPKGGAAAPPEGAPVVEAAGLGARSIATEGEPEVTETIAPVADRSAATAAPAIQTGRRDEATVKTASPAPPIDPRDVEPSERHLVAAAAVNRMTLRRAAHAEIDVPELGRIAVTARERARSVDVAVTASEHSLGVLRAAAPELTASLKDASIPLGDLSFGAGAGGHGTARDAGDPARSGERAAPSDHGAGGAPQPTRRQVRIVL